MLGGWYGPAAPEMNILGSRGPWRCGKTSDKVTQGIRGGIRWQSKAVGRVWFGSSGGVESLA